MCVPTIFTSIMIFKCLISHDLTTKIPKTTLGMDKRVFHVVSCITLMKTMFVYAHIVAFNTTKQLIWSISIIYECHQTFRAYVTYISELNSVLPWNYLIIKKLVKLDHRKKPDNGRGRGVSVKSLLPLPLIVRLR